ncbi:hypothetical protein OXYTRIMIC_711 [Oxytricha trifallax]|uniref:Uncharacterized protein n=1 Tax=Oxytricha trifallax TaxID=1172189 RepID=A0A073I0P6_9SPIT|nr:hypothetical protein OXYTRIMIC_711 [Oxytricha trifallax]
MDFGDKNQEDQQCQGGRSYQGLDGDTRKQIKGMTIDFKNQEDEIIKAQKNQMQQNQDNNNQAALQELLGKRTSRDADVLEGCDEVNQDGDIDTDYQQNDATNTTQKKRGRKYYGKQGQTIDLRQINQVSTTQAHQSSKSFQRFFKAK